MAESISDVAVGKTQRKVEDIPTEAILPPQPSGAYTVNDVIKAAFPATGTKTHGRNTTEHRYGKEHVRSGWNCRLAEEI